MLDRSPSRTRINNGRAHIGDVSPPPPVRTRGLPADLGDGGPSDRGVRPGARRDNRGWQAREGAGLDARATELLYMRSSKS